MIRGQSLGERQRRTHLGDNGSRAYVLYVPPGLGRGPVPLVVMLHGGTQNAADFAVGTDMDCLADHYGFVVVYPEQSREANPGGYWNWFRPQDQQAGSGEPAIIAGIVAEVMAELPIDADAVFTAGLSAGGAMSVVMAAARPDVFAAVCVHSGVGYRAAGRCRLRVRRPAERRSPGPARYGPDDRLPRHPGHRRGRRQRRPDGAGGVDRRRPPASRSRSSWSPPRTVRRGYTRTVHRDAAGRAVVESWLVDGGGHAWFGGQPAGSFTDPAGPDASVEMIRFFLSHRGRVRPSRA